MISIAKYIGTISADKWSWGAIKHILGRLDLHEYVVGDEVGTGGYHHYQFAVDCAGDLLDYSNRNHLGWHIEGAVDWERSKIYCRKDGRVHEWGDSVEAREYLRIKNRHLNEFQLDLERSISDQDDRSLVCWIDREGGNGKSTWCYLNEKRGRVFSLPVTEQSPNRIIDYIVALYDGEEIIVMDLPRANKLTKKQAEVLETVKDGNLKSTKYQGKKIFIRGVKIVVFTNNWIDSAVYKSLTEDRWKIRVKEERAKTE